MCLTAYLWLEMPLISLMCRLGSSLAYGPQDLRFKLFLEVIFSFTMGPFSAEEPLVGSSACLGWPLQACFLTLVLHLEP